MRINTQKGIAPIAAVIIALLIIGGGGNGIKKAAGNKKEKRVKQEQGEQEEKQKEEKMSEKKEDEKKAEVKPDMKKETGANYTAAGFVPKTITIKKGETVVFENKTGKSASVASNVHPTHLLYPEFDQYNTEQRGNTVFRFSFEKAGIWNYHDHLTPTMTGTVIVE